MASNIYQLNVQKAVSETVDGESIVINLETGNYYSLNPVGSIIWNLSIAKHSCDTIGAYCAHRYGLDEAAAVQYVDSFLRSLVAEGLLFDSSDQSVEPIESWNGNPEPFVAPAFVKYEDMQEMLLADPIHDVNESGWPILKKDIV